MCIIQVVLDCESCAGSAISSLFCRLNAYLLNPDMHMGANNSINQQNENPKTSTHVSAAHKLSAIQPRAQDPRARTAGPLRRDMRQSIISSCSTSPPAGRPSPAIHNFASGSCSPKAPRVASCLDYSQICSPRLMTRPLPASSAVRARGGLP